MVMDSDSDSENKASPVKKPAKKSRIQEDNSSDDEPKVKKSMSAFSFQKASGATPKASKSFDTPKKTAAAPAPVDDVKWRHEKLDFLKHDKIRDANKNKPTDPDYDWRTLYVPLEYLNELTPAMRQWWVLKSKHMDTVLFFKVGKFYELYHMDATVGVNHLGFSYMKVK